jgi:peptidyl-prolyl cis-trans isomerase D
MLKYLRMGNKRTKMIWWILVVVTVFTFVGGFIFLFGAGFDSSYQAQVAGALGTVNGEPITRVDFQNALNEQREAYRQRFKAEPGEQEGQMIEAQAWRSLVNQHLLTQQAKKLGLRAYDREVVLTLQAAPPQILSTIPDFQTNGQFDPTKYAAALRNPNINWAPFEQLVRDQLPVRKLQERLVASIKLSQPELQEAYQQRFERAALSLVVIPPAFDSPVAAPGEAELDRAYQKHRGRFNAPERVALEILSLPKRYSEEEIRVAREQAQSLVERARRGEDFAALARDFSEGPGADKGGELDRIFQPTEFGPELAPKLAAMQKGDISDPIMEPGRFIIVKVLERVSDPASPSPSPGIKLAQILIRVRRSEDTQREQLEELGALRARAQRVGLAKAATEKGLTTARTPFFPFGATPPQLYDVPEVADWAFGTKPGGLSPIHEASDFFLIAQIAERRDAGPAPKEDVIEQLRQLAEVDARMQAARPKADQVIQATAQGRSLEQAATGAGLAAAEAAPMTRVQPDPRLASSPEAIGAAFGAPLGRVVGPFEGPAGWIILRVNSRAPADTAAFEQIKGQVTTDVLSRKQNEFMQSWVMSQRRGAKIKDLRSGPN